jgi:amino-acid N-acetyltransferase
MFTIRPAQPTDLPAIQALLESHHLPLDDLAQHLATAVVAEKDGRVVATAALELYGSEALLRSVAVAESQRRTGLGRQLVQAILELAHQRGIGEVYLLTETAVAYFPRFGFQPIARAEVATAVQQSAEFTTACPASAQAMKLAL